MSGREWIEVVRPGSATTVQDLGRPGYGSQGVPAGGAFDPWAARAANRLVGNADGAAVLEVTLLGPRLALHSPAPIAIVGDRFDVGVEIGDLDVEEKKRAIEGQEEEEEEEGEEEEARKDHRREERRGAFEPGEAAVAIAGRPPDGEGGGAERRRYREGSILALGRARAGARCWLAVGGGGFDVPRVLGSRSTDRTGRFGGLDGRALQAGDTLDLFPSMVLSSSSSTTSSSSSSSSAAAAASLFLSSSLSSSLGEISLLLEEGKRPEEEATLRVLPGPDEVGMVEELVALRFTVLPESDRRGVRLRGSAALAPPPRPPMRSYATLPGAVQLPPSGEPIVLGVDAPVTGGYPWIAQVIEADVARLAHLAPGARVRFVAVSLTEAAAALAERERALERLVRSSG